MKALNLNFMKIRNMKSILILLMGMMLGISLHAQSARKTETIKIKTSAECDACKQRIEDALAYEKGIKSSDLDTASRIITVVYNPDKTSPDKIRKAISAVGYDADEVKADPAAFAKLPSCCKLDAKKKGK
jgi:copper chaperone CopZ